LSRQANTKTTRPQLPEVNAGIGTFTGILLYQINPASAFQHQVQYGTAGHGLLLYCPALLFSNKE
jgi:hypothetical protein